MGKGRVLRIFDTRAVFENLDTGSCLVASQVKENGGRTFERVNRTQLYDLGTSSQPLPFEAIFGIYDLLSGSYVAVVVESESYVLINQINIRRAKKILVVPLFKNGRLLSDSKQKDEDRYLQLLHMGFSEHSFFFSPTFDVTLSQQRIAKLQPKQLSEPFWMTADRRFFWNLDIVQELINFDADEWIVPFMSAFIEYHSACTIEETKFAMLFISRRSRLRQGCRFTKRGLDDDGNAANFVETEQILLFPDGKVTSYVQIRGSIPVKWCSPVHMRYDPKVYIDENRQLSTDFAQKHFSECLDKYGDISGNSGIIFINLVDNKKDQGKLGTAFKEVVDSVRSLVQPHNLTYVWFDFHHECKQKGKWKNLGKLVTQLDQQFRAQKFFCKLPNGQVTSWQTGVIRTNCMDNLDRTNVVQSLFARRSFMLQIGRGNLLDIPGSSVLESPFKTFEKTFKNMWANNANAMSLGYAGTGALKVDFTKTGKRTIKGMFNDGVNSCMRYYINNFTDGIKQDAIDLMIGRYKPDPVGPSPFGAKTTQESLSSNITKAFVLMMIIFSSLLLLLPPVYPFNKQKVDSLTKNGIEFPSDYQASENLKHLKVHLLISAVLTLLVVFYVLYAVVKKGSKIGEKIVVHPELCPESLPLERS